MSDSLREFGKFRNTIWTTAYGRKVKIHDMTNEHVINVIWWIKDNLDHYGIEMLQNFINEANFRGLDWSVKTPYVYPKKKYVCEKCDACTKRYNEWMSHPKSNTVFENM